MWQFWKRFVSRGKKVCLPLFWGMSFKSRAIWNRYLTASNSSAFDKNYFKLTSKILIIPNRAQKVNTFQFNRRLQMLSQFTNNMLWKSFFLVLQNMSQKSIENSIIERKCILLWFISVLHENWPLKFFLKYLYWCLVIWTLFSVSFGTWFFVQFFLFFGLN